MGQDSIYTYSGAVHLNEEEGLVTGRRKGHVLPSYDKGHITRWLALFGLTLVWVCGVVCIAIASSLFARQRPYTAVGQTAQLPAGSVVIGNQGEVYAFLVTALVTICTESTGFVHDISLRWDLFREGRLRWTTNLRLLSTSRVTQATRTPSNILYFFTLALAYTASSQIFVPTAFSATYMAQIDGSQSLELGTSASGAALMVLGICFVVQAAIVTWIYVASRQHIKTWSPNTLTILLACMSSDSAMVSASDSPRFSSLASTASRISQKIVAHRLGPPPPSYSCNKQASLFATRKVTLRRTLCVLSVLPVLIFIWAAIVLNAWKRTGTANSLAEFAGDHAKLGAVLLNSQYYPAIQPFPIQNDPGPEPSLIHAGTAIFVCLILVFCIQVYLTFALHCAEVLINTARDQRLWEKAARRGNSKPRGAPLNRNVVASLLASPPNVLLLAVKMVAHWLFNQSLLPVVIFSNSYDNAKWQCILTQISLFGVPTLFLAGAATVLAVISWYEACRSPRGAQPSTYGHLQTLTELVDEWGNGERLYWGDKGVTSDGLVRRAGTSGNADAVGAIHLDAEYI